MRLLGLSMLVFSLLGACDSGPPVPAQTQGLAGTNNCFYVCVSDPRGNYWSYSQYSACVERDCDRRGQPTNGTCTAPSNLFGNCP